MFAITYMLILSAMVTIVGSDFVCPGFGFVRPLPPCKDECSSNNDTCGAGKKCCYSPFSPCGYHCVVPKNNVQKPGLCPSPQSNQTDPAWNICDGHFCDVDSDCKCRKKCCPGRCGTTICIAPPKTKSPVSNN